jgi:hypothetical protein
VIYGKSDDGSSHSKDIHETGVVILYGGDGVKAEPGRGKRLVHAMAYDASTPSQGVVRSEALG